MAKVPSIAVGGASRFSERRELPARIIDRMKTIPIKDFGSAIILMALLFLFSLLSPQFATLTNSQAILESSAVPIVLAAGMTFIILQGSIDLSIEGIMAATSIAVSLLVANSVTPADYGWIGILAGLTVGLLFGLANGLLYVIMRLPSLIVTLATWFIGLGFATLMFPGRQPQILEPRLTSLALDKTFGLSTLVYVAVAVTLAAIVLQAFSQFGRMSMAIGIDEKTARLSGNSIRLHKVLAFSLIGLLSGLAGVMISAQLSVGNPSAGQGYLFPTISAAVIGGTLLSGGKGGVLQSITGVLILEVLRNGMIQTGVDPYLRHVVEGAIIVGALVVSGWQARSRDEDCEMTILSADRLSKTYPGVQALSTVSMELRENEILGLIGQNGSGKSTLLKLFTGIEQPSSGRILLRGKEKIIRSPLEAASLGVGLVHQEQSLIPNLTVAENIFFDKKSSARKFGFYNWRTLNRAAEQQLKKLESDIPPDIRVENLSFSQRQMVEFAKVLAVEELVDEPLVILFDEPTSLLSPSEIDDLFRQIQRLKHRASIVFVSHRMDEVLKISDRVHVMSNGENVAERLPGQTDHRELYQLMVGVRRSDDYYLEERRKSFADAPRRLGTERLSKPGAFRNISLDVREGEIVALTGVAGSGAEEVCRAIFGLEDGTKGRIFLGDEERPVNATPSQNIAMGIGYVAAERKLEGVVTGRSIIDNIVLTFGSLLGRGGVINRERETREALFWMDRLKVKTPNAAEYVERLSGGNQQKVSLAKWLMSPDLKLLILDHPTRGLDPGAKADLFEAMRDLADQGVSILFVSETLEETLGMADTIVVMRDGVVSAAFRDLNAFKPAPEAIVEAMV
ncbi:ATP-binding cassette domain-containing protein (plasmid) [Rhizobium sp. RCAM05350]|nr:ATP-binding cassette domain-containing protein [Rhizobium sp. RCAM05350]